MKNEFGADHNADSTFFFLDEDGDVLSVSSQSEFADNDDVLLAAGANILTLIYAKLENREMVGQ